MQNQKFIMQSGFLQFDPDHCECFSVFVFSHGIALGSFYPVRLVTVVHGVRSKQQKLAANKWNSIKVFICAVMPMTVYSLTLNFCNSMYSRSVCVCVCVSCHPHLFTFLAQLRVFLGPSHSQKHSNFHCSLRCICRSHSDSPPPLPLRWSAWHLSKQNAHRNKISNF